MFKNPDPTLDGTEYCNIFSRGNTQLGQLLSNFAHVSVSVNGIIFASIEAWWYFTILLKARAPLTEKEDTILRNLYGYLAKKQGKLLVDKYIGPVKDFHKYHPTRDECKYICKLKALNPDLKQLIAASSLPFKHFYVFANGGISVPKAHQFWCEIWEDIRTQLQRNNPPAPVPEGWQNMVQVSPTIGQKDKGKKSKLSAVFAPFMTYTSTTSSTSSNT